MADKGPSHRAERGRGRADGRAGVRGDCPGEAEAGGVRGAGSGAAGAAGELPESCRRCGLEHGLGVVIGLGPHGDSTRDGAAWGAVTLGVPAAAQL